MKKIQDYIKFAEIEFPGDNLKIKRYEAELILSDILNLNRIDIYTIPNINISGEAYSKIDSFFRRRIDNEPIQYILGYTYFRNLKLLVNKNVLIPRPETELLVDEAIKLINIDEPLILDIGTGSGAIALSLASEIKKSKVFAIDISSDALKVAKKNSELNNINNVSFLNNNLCEPSNIFFNIDIIIANLPYVTEKEYINLDDTVKKHEPKLALHGGQDGLDLIRKLITQSVVVLKEKGWLLLEIGFTQGEKTADLFNKTNCFDNIEILKDYSDRDRMVIAQKKFSARSEQ